MRIGLMADIPDQPVVRGFENIMQRDRQFDDPKSAPNDARDRYGRNRLVTQFVSDLTQLIRFKLAKIGRYFDCIEQGSRVFRNVPPNC